MIESINQEVCCYLAFKNCFKTHSIKFIIELIAKVTCSLDPWFFCWNPGKLFENVFATTSLFGRLEIDDVTGEGDVARLFLFKFIRKTALWNFRKEILIITYF